MDCCNGEKDDCCEEETEEFEDEVEVEIEEETEEEEEGCGCEHCRNCNNDCNE